MYVGSRRERSSIPNVLRPNHREVYQVICRLFNYEQSALEATAKGRVESPLWELSKVFQSKCYLAAIVLGAVSTLAAAQESPSLGSVVDLPKEARPTNIENLDPIEAQLRSMSLRQKVGQLMLVTFQSNHNPSSDERRFLNELTPGGVFLPAVTSPLDFEVYVRDIRLNPVEVELKIPILIATDYFGLATLRHTESPYAQIPTPLALAACANQGPLRESAGIIADYMETLGVGLHWGPSLGLCSTMDGAPTSLNHFGEEPGMAAAAAETLTASFQSRGVSWAPLQFPGGDTNRTGRDPAVLLTPRSLLLERDLAPYVKAIDGGVQFIHTGNTLVPTLDSSGMPASVSYEVMTKLLREELGYEGVVIAGPMDAADLKRGYKGSNAPERALLAGADMLWWEGSGPLAARWILKLAQRVEGHKLPESLIDEKVRRILRAKQELGLQEKALPKERAIHRLAESRKKGETSRKLEQAGIVLVKSTQGLFPLTNENSVPLGIAGVMGVEELHDALEKKKLKPLAQFPIGTAKHGKQIFTFEMDRMLRHAKGTRTVICIFTTDVSGSTQRELLRRIRALGARTISVFFGVPEDLELYLDDSDAAIVLLKDYRSRLDSTMGALADVMLGLGPVRILEPARDLKVAVNEAVTFDIGDLAVTPAGRLPVSMGETIAAGHAAGFAPPLNGRKVTWLFGDGEQAGGAVVEHAYAAPGRYTLSVSIHGGGEALATGDFGIVVSGER